MNGYIETALSMGADNAVLFKEQDIAYDSRVVLKCLFGCGDYGKVHTCPYQKSPLSMEEYEKILKRYEWGVIIGCGDKHLSQRISYEIERACFLDGYYFAFSLSDCGLCGECAKAGERDCRFPLKARPAFHSVGIDVFKTVRRLGLPITVLQNKGEPVNWYSAVFIE
jgi:predicted metal-binding protein